MEFPAPQTLARPPLAEAVLTLWRWAADADSVDPIFDEHRGRCSTKILIFSTLVGLVRDALLASDGGGQPSFEAARDRGEPDASARAAYGKLGRTPIPVSSASLAGCTARLSAIYPRDPRARTPLPASRDDSEVLVFDGKAIKRVAKRLQPLWAAAGGLLGGRAPVAPDRRRGSAVARRAHPEGEANEARFVGDPGPEVRRLVAAKRLWIADSSFGDRTQPGRFAGPGDAFLIRSHPRVPFAADPARSAREGHDGAGRRYVEDWGGPGRPLRPKKRRSGRRITLARPGEKAVALVTNLLDAEAVPAVDPLTADLARGGIGRMFQPVTEVFGLSHLIGTRPEGGIFQCAMGPRLYDLIQVVRGVIAVEAEVPREAIAGEELLQDVERQMIARGETVPPEETVAHFRGEWTGVRVQVRLSEWLSGVWRDRWLKAPPKTKAAPRQKERKRTQSSVYRILEAHQQRLKKEKRRVQLT